jgi:putative sterol carrier protein
MATKEDVVKGFASMKARLQDSALKEKVKDVTRTIQFSFPDLAAMYVVDVVKGEVVVVKEGVAEKPDMLVTMKSEEFLGVVSRKVNPVMSYMTGKIKVKCAPEDLMMLQKILS